jgi:prepilin peptidase CpaA
MQSIRYVIEGIDSIKTYVEGCLLVALILPALINDIKHYKIPNKLNLLFLIAGVLFNLLNGCISSGLIGIVFPFILFPFFVLRMMGAGDIKLFCAIGAIVGFPHILDIMAYSILFNGAIAVILMLARKDFGGYKRLWQWCKLTFVCGRVFEYQTMDNKQKNIFRYAYGITLGCFYYIVTTLILGGRYALL